MRSTSRGGKGSKGQLPAKITPQPANRSFTTPYLQIFTVNWSDLQGIWIDTIQAADIDGDRFAAVGGFAAAERTHPAVAAEQVMDDFLVELVVAELLGARFQLKLISTR